MNTSPNNNSLFGKAIRLLVQPIEAIDNGKQLIPTPSTCPLNNSFDLGSLYNKARQKILGEGCSKDYVGAHNLLEQVLQFETDPSELRELALLLAAMNFIDGRGVEADSNRAFKLLCELNCNGSSEGAFGLGLFFEGRFGAVHPTTINFDLASFFYSRAARTGHLAARTNLALLHIQHRIANSNAKYGWDLLHASAKQGDLVAAKAIKKLTSSPRI